MKTIEYKITYGGTLVARDTTMSDDNGEVEFTRVPARDINSGFTEALRRAKQPLGNGQRRLIFSVEFSQVL